jgi:hypothetical protein
MNIQEVLKVIRKLSVIQDEETGDILFPDLCNCGRYSIDAEDINSQEDFEASAKFWKYNEKNELPEDPLLPDELPITWQDILDYSEEVQIETYRENRKSEYPPLEEQLDYIYHNGVDAWKTDIIDPIKDKYPKPTVGIIT